jgi:CO dehydrogenase/acetyl-CoA synthase delta subunit
MAKRQVITKVHATEKMHVAVVAEGANQHAHILLRKKKDETPTPPTNLKEESDMDPKIMKALLALDQTGKDYVLGLPDDQITAHFAKTADEQATDIKKHVEAAELAKAKELEKAKADPLVADLMKKVDGLTASVGTLQAENDLLKNRTLETDLEKSAKSDYPLVPDALNVLKSIQGLDEAGRKVVTDSLKARQDMAKKLVKTYGADDVTDHEGSAKVIVKTKIAELAKSMDGDTAKATLAFNSDPANAELIAQVREEETAPA